MSNHEIEINNLSLAIDGHFHNLTIHFEKETTMEIFKKGVNGLPDRFPIKQKARFFSNDHFKHRS